jgi:hypothetical protein
MSCFDDQELLQLVFGQISPSHLDLFASLPQQSRETLETSILELIHEDNQRREPDLAGYDSSEPGSISDSKLVQGSLPANEYTKQCQERPDGTWKLEITSTRESTFSVLGCFGLVGFVVLIASGEVLISVLVLALALSSGYLWSKTDDYLVVQPQEKMIFYHKKFLGTTEMEPYIPFDHISTLAVEGTFHKGKDSSWWTHKTVAVTRDGEMIALSDDLKNGFHSCCAFANALAARLGTSLLEPMPDCCLQITGSGSRVQVQYDVA